MSARSARAAAVAAAWTVPGVVGAALVDAHLLERWYGVSARLPVHYPELALNALAGAALAALGVALVTRLGARRRRRVAWDLVAGGLALVAVGIAFLARHATGEADGISAFAPAALVVLAGAGIAGLARERRAVPWLRGVVLVLVVLALTGESVRAPIARARAGGGAPQHERRNVVLIVIDTLRADHLSCHGYPLETTPEIDALAASGVRFEHAIAQASWTLPATASIHTGRFPSSHGAVARGQGLAPGAETLAESLANASYRCAGFSENQIVSARYGFDQGFDWLWSYWLPWVTEETLTHAIRRRLGVPAIRLAASREYPSDPTRPEEINWDARRTAGIAIDWLRAARDGSRPFFAYVHFMGPHGPYGPPEFLLDVEPPAVRVADHPRDMGGGYPLAPPGDSLDVAAYAALRTLYAADIRYVDREVGRIVAELDRLGILDETLVVVTSDHGEEFYEHGGWNHGGSVFEEIVHVPLVVAGGGVPMGGRVVPTPVRHVDLVPTILGFARVGAPEGHGRDLWPAIAGGAPLGAASRGADAVLVEGCFVRPAGIDGVALYEAGRKLVRIAGADTAATRLYDLERDPLERVDLSAREAVIVDSLRAELARWEQIARLFDPADERIRLDAESVRALRRLGYLQ